MNVQWRDGDYVEYSPADEAMRRANLANLLAFFKAFPDAFPPGLPSRPGLYRWLEPVPHPWFSGVISGPLPPETADEIVDETITHYSVRGAPIFSWWPALDTPSAALEPLLLDYGLQHVAHTPAMVCDLQAVNVAEPLPPGLTIRPAATTGEAVFIMDLMTDGFELPEVFREPLVRFARHSGWQLPYRHYLGLLDGEPAATALLLLAEGVAGIYNISTLPGARRRGIGRAMTLAPMRDARELGYKVAILQASKMGYPVYERMGYRFVGNLGCYQWQNPASSA